MRKLITLLLLAAMVMTAFAGCKTPDNSEIGNPSDFGDINETPKETPNEPDEPGEDIISELPEGVKGSDVAKLLLAGERLSDHLVNTDDNIFNNGVTTYTELAQKASDSLKNPVVNLASLSEESAEENKNPIKEDPFSPSGTSVYTELPEFCRPYEMFQEYVNYIVSNAELGANMIDYVKKNVKVVDMWVKTREGEFYLEVDENSETIIQKEDYRINICRRYKNEKGQDVYELLEQNDFMNRRSTYISGEHYELTMVFLNHDRDRYDIVVADKTKGYWEVFSNSTEKDEIYFPGETLHSPQFFIIKDDICYDFMHLYRYDETRLTMISPNRDSEILVEQTSGGKIEFTFRPAAFTGWDSVIVNEETQEVQIMLSNGKILESEQAYNNGELVELGETIPQIFISRIHGVGTAWGMEVEVMLSVYSDVTDDYRRTFKEHLDSWGLECKYGSLDSLFAKFDRAYDEAEAIVDYYKWLGYSIDNGEDMTKAREIEEARYAEMLNIYEERKDAPKVDMDNDTDYQKFVKFAAVTANKKGEITYADGKATLKELELTVNDTLLFVDGEPYIVAFALKSQSGGLVHISFEEPLTATYQGGEELTVSTGEISFEIPALVSGEYTLVTYISTADGIRSSAYTDVIFDTVADTQTRFENITINVSHASNGAMLVKYEYDTEIYVDITGEETIDYNAFYQMVADKAYVYGLPSEALIEKKADDDTYVALTGTETVIEDGTYRLGYTVVNGETNISGYVYVEYSVSVTSEPEETDPVKTEGEETNPIEAESEEI